MTPAQNRVLLLAKARRRRAEAEGGAPATAPSDRISGAFEAAAEQPETRLRPKGYGITDSAMMSLPFADELDAAIAAPARYLSGRASSLGEGYAQQKALSGRYQQDFAAEHPVQATLGTAAGIAAMGPQRLASGALAAVPVAATRLGRAGQGAASGAGISAVYGAGEGSGLQERIANAAIGGTTGAILGGGLGGIGRNTSAALPAVDALKTAKDAAYGAVDATGARYSSGSFNLLHATMEKAMKASKLNPRRHPKAASMMDEIASMRGTAEGAPTITELDQLRQVIKRDVVDQADKSERVLGLRMIQAIDRFTDSAVPKSVKMTGGNVGQLMRNARLANQTFRKAEQINDAIVRAIRRTTKTGSGGNLDNNIRDEIFKILDNANKRRGYSKAELEIMEKIVAGDTRGQALLRLVGKLSPQGNGLSLILNSLGTAGSAAALGPAGLAVAAPAVIGAVAKPLATRMTTGKADELQRLVRTGTTARGHGRAPVAGAQLRKLLGNEFGAGSR